MADLIITDFVKYYPMDIQFVAKNFTQDISGVQIRQKNFSNALWGLANAINRLHGYCTSRPIFHKSLPYVDCVEDSFNPAYHWIFNDKVRNARNQTAYIITCLPANTNQATSKCGRYSYKVPDGCNSAEIVVNITSADQYRDVLTAAFFINRGDRTNAEVTEGVSTYNKYKILSISVYEDPVTQLDTSLHVYCNPRTANIFKPILADALEDLRSKLHQIRTENLPIVLSWAALGPIAQTSAPGSQQGIGVISVSDVNLFDQSVAARSATSPGAFYAAQYGGIGPEWSTAGKQIKVMCRVKGNCDVSYNGVVTFYGPTGFANNYTSITVDDLGNWLGDSTNFIYLDSSIANNVTDATGNKIDVYGRCADGVNILSVYGLRCYVATS